MSEDLISKEKAYEVLTEYYHHKTEIQHKALREALDRMPSVDIDLSDYSDRLWRNAYERGKADAEVERKKGKWIRKDDYYNGIIMRVCKCSVCDANAGIGQDGFWYKSNYCPNCGADLRGEDE